MHKLELVYNKNYFNCQEIFSLRLFKMAANQMECFGVSDANHIKLTEECVTCLDKCVLVKNLYKWSKFLKDSWNNIQDKKTGQKKMGFKS